MFEGILEGLGLSDKETKVYLTLLKSEHSSVLDLSKETELNRTTMYPVLESLSKKGLVSEIKIDKKVRYVAESPERLETYVSKRKIQLEEQQKKLKDVIPQLKSLQREGAERPVINYFEGKEGILSASKKYFEELPSEYDEAYFLYNDDLIKEVFTEKEIKEAKGNRKKKKVKSVAFYVSEKGTIKENSSDSMRFKIDGEKYPVTCDIGIYGDNVRINTLGKKISAIYINSKDLATSLKSLFNMLKDSIDK